LLQAKHRHATVRQQDVVGLMEFNKKTAEPKTSYPSMAKFIINSAFAHFCHTY